MERQRVITAEEMDRMTPNERAEAVRAGIVRDLSGLPPAFRQRIEERAAFLESELASSEPE